MAKARGGGATVPQYYLDLLKKAADWGAIAHFVDEVCDVQELDGAHRVAFNKSEPLVATKIILATGSQLDCETIPLLRDTAKRLALPVVSCLPAVDDSLRWG